MPDRLPTKRIATPVGERSRTKQSLTEATDINAIMRKYQSTGLVPHINRQEPRYGDFSSGLDFHAALEKVRTAQALFDELPAEIRDHCKNDPGRLLDMVFNPNREEEVRKLGLIPPKEVAPEDPANQPKEPAPE